MIIHDEFAIDEENPLGLEGELVFDVSMNYIPGEKMVRYYPDGSGYPGSPPEIEILDARCKKIDGRAPTESEISDLKDWAMEKADNPAFIEESIHNHEESKYDESDNH